MNRDDPRRLAPPPRPQRGPIDWLNTRYGTWRGWVRMCLGQIDWHLGRLRRWSAPDLGGAKRLVFVCLGNINRSAFASEVARRLGEPSISIGLSTTTGVPAFEQAVVQAERHGINLSRHRATDFHDYEYAPGDLLLAMEVRHVLRLRELGIPDEAIALLGAWSQPRRIHLHDPHTLSPEYFATCFAIIEKAVTRLVEQRTAARRR